MRSLPWWTWLLFAGGLGLLGAAGTVPDGTYNQAVMIEVGSTALLVVPIVLAERVVVDTLKKRMRDAAAVQRTEESYRTYQIFKQWGQAPSSTTLPPTTPEQLWRMLMADGWTWVSHFENHHLWQRDDLVFAVPRGSDPLPRAVVFGVSRYAGWQEDRYIELWNATRGEMIPP